MNARSGLIISFPADSSSTLSWWHVEDSEIVASGSVHPDAEDVTLLTSIADIPVMAIVPAALATVRWTGIGDLAPRQAETAARIKTAEETLGAGEALHIVSNIAPNDQIMVASMSVQQMQFGLDILAALGVDPDIILPAGLIISPPETGFVRASFASETVLRSARSIVPDEPALRQLIVADTPVVTLDAGQVDAAMAAALRDPPINMRSGQFTKRSPRGAMSARQWQVLAGLAAAGILFSLLLAIATWVKYDRAIKRENSIALQAVKTIAPQVSNIEEAQALLNRELMRRGAGGFQVTGLAAATFVILQQVEGVTLRDVRSNGDGIFAFTLAAPNADGINQVLSIMQKQGYRVTAVPRQDASGLTLADISVRAK
jgi:general secretion pathway protein L